MTQLTDRPTAGQPAPPQASEPTPRTRASLSPHIGLRELILVILGGFALSCLMNWPLPAHLSSTIPEDLGDPVRTAWQLAWVGHALLNNPTHLYEANAFWPLHNSLAFSDSLLGYAPSGLIGSGVAAAIVRYNLLFLFAYAACFIGAYLLARELGVRRLAAIVAGVAFAYAPFRLTMNGHLHVISSGGIPLTLFLLYRGYRRRSWKLIAGGWVAAAWQLSLGFTTGLQLGYLLGALFLIALVAWWRAGRPMYARSLVITTIAGILLFGAVGYVQGRPLLKVSHDYPNATRSDKDIKKFSAPPKAFLSAPPEDRLWGSVTKPIRDTLSTPNEQNQFPGVTIFLLAALGLVAGAAYTRRMRIGMLIGILIVAYLSLGYDVAGGTHVYRFWFNHAPGFNGIRTPGRLITLTSLGLALLAAAGADRIIAWVGARRALGRVPRWAAVGAPVAIAGVLVLGVLAEGKNAKASPKVPPVPAGMDAAPGPQLHLPASPAFNRVYMLWTSNRFQKIANGVATFRIDSIVNLQNTMDRFPNTRAVRLLRRAGFRTVFIHLDMLSYPIPRKWNNPQPHYPRRAAAKDVSRIPGVTRVQINGNTIRYDLKPVPHPLNSLREFNGG